MIRTYSVYSQGGVRLSDNFRVREFACRDGSDKVLIDDALVVLLQKIRRWAGGAVTINSGYRSSAYNKKVGGAVKSCHLKGQAADISVSGKLPSEVARFAQAVGAGGVGCYNGVGGRFVHVDTRAGRYFWINTDGIDRQVSGHSGDCPYGAPSGNLSRGNCGNGVMWLQWWLNLWGCGLSVDGSFGAKTQAAVLGFQRRTGLVPDGIAGPVTRRALMGGD